MSNPSPSGPSKSFDPAEAYSEERTRPTPSARSEASSKSRSTGRSAGEASTKLPRGPEAPMGGKTRARGAEGRRRGEAERSAALAPPTDPELFASDEEWRRFHEAEEKTGGWHHLPLVLVVLPPLGAIVHGRAENWSDGIILVLVCFYLYQLIKVPWDLYYASHARYILPGTMPTEGPEALDEDPLLVAHRQKAASILRRTELISLAATAVVPIAGAYLLFYVRNLLSDPDRYINKFTISLFAFATAIKPLLHLSKLAKNTSLYYQEAVWYPSTEVHLLRRRIDALEADISQLHRAFATKDDVRTLRDGVDIPLSQLSKAVRRFNRQEEYLRLSSEERFALLDAKLDEAARDMAANAQMIEMLRQEQAQSAFATIVRVLSHVIQSAREGRTRRMRWYERGPLYYILLPVNVSALAIEWVAGSGEEESKKVR